jgi:hypothetical protein
MPPPSSPLAGLHLIGPGKHQLNFVLRSENEVFHAEGWVLSLNFSKTKEGWDPPFYVRIYDANNFSFPDMPFNGAISYFHQHVPFFYYTPRFGISEPLGTTNILSVTCCITQHLQMLCYPPWVKAMPSCADPYLDLTWQRRRVIPTRSTACHMTHSSTRPLGWIPTRINNTRHVPIFGSTTLSHGSSHAFPTKSSSQQISATLTLTPLSGMCKFARCGFYRWSRGDPTEWVPQSGEGGGLLHMETGARGCTEPSHIHSGVCLGPY